MDKSKKRKIYISAFVLLGVLVQFLAHAVIEIIYINLLKADYDTWGLGLSFNDWLIIHAGLGIAFFISGIVLGYYQGKYWWKRIYGKKQGQKTEK